MEWNRAAPTCQIKECPAPPAIENGQIDDTGVTYEYNAVVKYSCDVGFKLSRGDSNSLSVRCDETATWVDVPTCMTDLDCTMEDYNTKFCSYTAAEWRREYISTGRERSSYYALQTSITATLTSPTLDLGGAACLSFFYISNAGNGLQVKSASGDVLADMPATSADWSEGKVTIPDGSLPFTIATTSKGLVWLDDISVTMSACSEPTTTTAAPTTTEQVVPPTTKDGEDITTKDNNNNGNDGSSLGVVVGVSIAVVVLCVMVGVVIYQRTVGNRKRKKENRLHEMAHMLS